MERSFKLLREGGVTSLIVSDAFGHAKYALKAREWFLRHARIHRVDFYSSLKLFDAAVHNISYVFQRVDPGRNEPMRRLHHPEFGEVELLATARQDSLTERAFVPGELYRPPPGDTVPLSDLCYVSVGMVVHAHEKHAPGAFVLDDLVSEAKDKLHPKPFSKANTSTDGYLQETAGSNGEQGGRPVCSAGLPFRSSTRLVRSYLPRGPLVRTPKSAWMTRCFILMRAR